ncbi:MAG: gamma-glutamyltransferase, partial [Pseudomonadota bacterium]
MRRVSLTVVLATLIGWGCAVEPEARETAFVPASVNQPDGVVASRSAWASDVGARMLAQGGNAVDAAVAAGFALAVTYP